MPAYLGATALSAPALGATQLKAITKGGTLVWPILKTIADNFDRSDSTGLGSNWTQYGNTGAVGTGVVSNTARSRIQTTDGTYYCRNRYNADKANTDDQYVKCSIAAVNSAASGRVSSIGLRGYNDGDLSGGAVVLYFENNTAYIGTVISGTSTNRSGTLSAVAAGDAFELRAVGRVFTAYRNGSSIGSWTDTGAVTMLGSSYRSGALTSTSVRSFFTNYYSYSLDNWEFGDLSPV